MRGQEMRTASTRPLSSREAAAGLRVGFALPRVEVVVACVCAVRCAWGVCPGLFDVIARRAGGAWRARGFPPSSGPQHAVHCLLRFLGGVVCVGKACPGGVRTFRGVPRRYRVCFVVTPAYLALLGESPRCAQVVSRRC